MRGVRVVLASASPRRRELLMQVGFEPVVMPSHVEEVVKSREPDVVVRDLSSRKAEDVAGRWMAGERLEVDGEGVEGLYDGREKEKPGKKEKEKDETKGSERVVVIGADTVVAVDGRILGKPGSRREAEEMIGLLQGREHQVYTGVAMIFGDTGERVVFSEKTDVFVYPMSRNQIGAYVDTGEPMDKAGAYGIQGVFAAYIRGIEGDYNNVVGLPVGRVCQELMARDICLEGL